MKFINLDGLTTAERLVVLENICNDIIKHLNQKTMYTTTEPYKSSILSYDITKLYPEINEMPESGQVVYFSNGYIGIIGNIDTIANTYGVSEVVSVRGDDAIEYSGKWETSVFPINGNTFIDNEENNYSRTPKSGDKIIICGFTATSPKRSFMCLGTFSGTSDFRWTINNIVETTGEKGEKGADGESPTLFRHCFISFQNNVCYMSTILLGKTSTPYNVSMLAQELRTIGHTSSSTMYPASGWRVTSGDKIPIVGIYATGSSVYVTDGTSSSVIYSVNDMVSEV